MLSFISLAEQDNHTAPGVSRTCEDEIAGWHHQLNGHEFEQALGDGDGQGGLACYSPWGCRVGHTEETELNVKIFCLLLYAHICFLKSLLQIANLIFV